jgi:hypothetical protein
MIISSIRKAKITVDTQQIEIIGTQGYFQF